jgi:hypothetical protein
MSNDSAGRHAWSFVRSGGFDQAQVRDASALTALRSLDQKLWAALACPVSGLEIDKRTLELLDADGDGRIRVPEVLAAIAWAEQRLKSLDTLVEAAPALPLAAIRTDTAEAKEILASAQLLLGRLGRPADATISLGDLADQAKLIAAAPFNGDGVVPAASAEAPELAAAIADLVKTGHRSDDASGAPGVTRANVQAFLADAAAFEAWCANGEGDPAVQLHLAVAPAAAAAVDAVAAKVEDFFARCRLAAFDGRATGALNREEAAFQALAAQALRADSPEIASLPLARVEPGAALPLSLGLNPAWAAAIEGLRREAVTPILGPRETLSEAQWRQLGEALAPWRAWIAAKAGAAVEGLGRERLRALSESAIREGLEALHQREDAVGPEIKGLAAVEKLVRLQRDLVRFLESFVNFRTFYSADEQAIWQAGTLFLDQRTCRLCIRVADPGAHAAGAAASNTYLAYCKCTRPASGETMHIAAAFTGGDADFLSVGRNGVFYDRAGRDWDATIVKIVEQPVSLRQAFWSPYRRIARLIDEQIAKLASAREKEVEAASSAGVEGAAAAATAAPGAKPAVAKPPFDIGKFVGIFAAIGLAIGAIGGALGAMVAAFASLAWWQMPLAILGIMLLISGPSVIIAWLKLRKRNIGPMLDACGWAVNARAMISVPFGGSLTKLASLPAGSRRNLSDPYAPKRHTWVWILLLILAIVVALFCYGVFDGLLAQVFPPAIPKT